MLKVLLSNIMTNTLSFFGRFASPLWSVVGSWLYTPYCFCTALKNTSRLTAIEQLIWQKNKGVRAWSKGF